ncbi:hypothetical protein TBR22_A45330 [Luteitalea sp. TBR-22]|uniref:DUF255 domain-containing protein n=1 Tax=Luteitalea sp. TBR-22 TaxID=2802971 RepID=UPI001AFA315F|nr:DUF255 domain-containing protein [Luteitalea sp. TBR-22]BCS35306.1 hypothetical protein TBR22_A45330 [Luteitalea sp. TBR-22]
MAPPDWQPWHTAAFLDAQRRRRPVLLLLEAAWAPASADAHARVFARPDVAAAIAEGVVPVRVDVDRRPDIADRYGLGQWPTLLLLTPEGHVLTGGTRLDESLAARLRVATDAYAAHGWRTPPPAPTTVPPGADPPDVGADQAGDVLEAVMQGVAAPTLSPSGAPAALAALCAFAWAAVGRDADWAAMAASLLDAAAEDLPRDPDADDAGGPRRLEDEAAWVRVLARAVCLDALPSWQSHLERRVAALRALRRNDGHWRPWVGAGGLVLVDASARACAALLAAAAAMHDDELAREAIEALEVLAPAAYARGAGVSHVLEHGHARGPLLLDDAMAMAVAVLDADQWRDEPVYRDLAEELLQTALARLAHPSGALVDRVATLAGAGQVGRLAEPHFPLVGNAEAARLLVRLHGDDPEAMARARRILVAIGEQAGAAGVFAAPVGLAWIGLEPGGRSTTAW